jgi:hypothetical protein
MACRDEHPTRHNRASFLRIQHALSNISEYWVRYRIRRVLRLQYMKMKRKVRAWKRDMITFRHNCRELLRKYKADSSSVTVGDWDKITTGKEKKLQIVYGKHYTKKQWPRNIPWLNLIAYAQYRAAHAARKVERAEQKARKAEVFNKRADAAAKTADAAAKKAKALEKEKNDVDSIPWGDPVAMEALFKAHEYQNKQMERQLELVRRSRSNPTWVSHKQWLAAIQGTDALKTDRTVACYVELARRRETGEPCDGWVYGRYFGP